MHRRAANACRWASTQAGHHLICGQSFRHPAIIVIRVSDNAQERVRWDTRSRIDAAVTPTASYWASFVATDTGVHHTLEFFRAQWYRWRWWRLNVRLRRSRRWRARAPSSNVRGLFLFLVQHDATDKQEAARDNYSFPYGGYPLLLLWRMLVRHDQHVWVQQHVRVLGRRHCPRFAVRL